MTLHVSAHEFRRCQWAGISGNSSFQWPGSAGASAGDLLDSSECLIEQTARFEVFLGMEQKACGRCDWSLASRCCRTPRRIGHQAEGRGGGSGDEQMAGRQGTDGTGLVPQRLPTQWVRPADWRLEEGVWLAGGCWVAHGQCLRCCQVNVQGECGVVGKFVCARLMEVLTRHDESG